MGKYMRADEKMIKALLYESEISRYKISKDTGIPDNTLSDLANGKTSFENMRFGTAAKLTEYAESVDLTNHKLTPDQIKEMGEMKNIFKTYDDLDQFKKEYVNILANPPEDYHKYGWDVISDELIAAMEEYREHDVVGLIINRTWTRSKKDEYVKSGFKTHDNQLTYSI